MTTAEPAFGMLSVDTQLVVRTWDPWIAAISKVPAERALNRPISAVLPGLEERGLLDVLRRALEFGTVEVLAPALHEFMVACPPLDPSSGLPRMQQRVSIGPIRDDGRITGLLVTIEDVTERVERERSLVRVIASASPSAVDRLSAVNRLAAQGPAIVDARADSA